MNDCLQKTVPILRQRYKRLFALHNDNVYVYRKEELCKKIRDYLSKPAPKKTFFNPTLLEFCQSKSIIYLRKRYSALFERNGDSIYRYNKKTVCQKIIQYSPSCKRCVKGKRCGKACITDNKKCRKLTLSSNCANCVKSKRCGKTCISKNKRCKK